VNNILHFLDGVNGQSNHYSYELSDPGAYETIQGSFDFRILPGTAGLADGLGLVLIPTALDPTGDGPNPLAEKPDLAGAFGLGIDVYPGINNVSTHFGTIVGEVNPNYAVSFRDNLVFNRVLFTLQRVGNATNATVSLISDSLGTTPGLPVKIMETVIPNMLPYENRVQFGGRTGGENLKADIDNLNVAYSNPYTGGLPAAPTGHTYQDFDSTGTTSYRAVQAAAPNGTVFRPGPLIKAPDAGSNGSFLRIVNDGVEGQSNRVVFDHSIDSGASNMTEIVRLDLRFNSTDQPADGLGLLFLATRDPFGTAHMTSNGIDSSEEPNHPNMLGIGFDVYDNSTPEIPDVAPGVSLHWNGSTLTNVPLPPSFALNQFHRVEVTRETLPTGLNVTVTGIPNINGVPGAPVTLIDHFFVEGASNYDYRLQLSGRTGGANADHDIDNIVTSQITKAPLARTQSNFDQATGSAWKGYVFETGAGPDVRNDLDTNGNYLRLAYDTVNGQRNAVAFDKQVDGSLNGRTKVTADVDFRATNTDGFQAADGFSLLIIPTATFGDTGPGAASTPNFIAEKPNVAGVFGIGFDVYNGPGQTINEATVHWNNGQVASMNIDPFQLDLLAGVFHHLHLELEDTDLGTLVDLILTPDFLGAPGVPVVVFEDLLVSGMDLYDYRFEMAARTGGLNLGVDIDNVLVQTIPEPSTATLLGLGALLIGRRRRSA
jgi:hypothetical protein